MAEDWPRWPADDPGVVLSDFIVEKPLDETFKLLHGAREFRDKMNTVNRYEGFAATPWVATVAEAEAACPTTAPPSGVPGVDDLKVGMTAKRTFVAVNSMGRIQTTELQRIEAAAPSSEVVLESFVATTGKYGDKFRPMIRRTLHVEDEGKGTRVRSVGTVVYLGSVNGMIKGMIQKGAINGMKDSCAKMEALLKEYAPVRPYGVPLGAPPAAAAPVAAAPEVSSLRAMLQDIAGEAAVTSLYPWAAFLHAALAHLPLLRWATPDAVLTAAVLGLALGALHIVLELLRFGASAGAAPRGALAWAARLIFRFLHVPASSWEVLTTVALAFLARAGMSALTAALPAPPAGGSRPSSAAAGAAPTPEDSDANAGVKYDGYGAAIAGSAGKNYVGAGKLGKMDEQSEVALEALRAGLLRVGSLAKHRGADNAARRHAAKDHLKERREAQLHRVKQKHAEHHSRGPAPTTAGDSRPDTPESIAAEADEEAHLLTPQGYAGAELPPPARAAAVVESIFENERLQPFRGFGHTWPGHFLPSDRVMHWSRMDYATRTDTVISQDLDEVAPPLPPGWRWVEPTWTLDLTGVFSDSTDNEGWSYGLDFSWVVYPFQPGAGRKKMADFVRRRRWLRTRVPVEAGDASSQTTQSVSVSATEGATNAAEGGGSEGEGDGAESAAPAAGAGGGSVSEALQQGIASVAEVKEEEEKEDAKEAEGEGEGESSAGGGEVPVPLPVSDVAAEAPAEAVDAPKAEAAIEEKIEEVLKTVEKGILND